MKYSLNNQAKDTPTEITIGRGALDEAGRLAGGYSKVVVITDEATAKNCLNILKDRLGIESDVVVLPGGEEDKNLDLAGAVLRRLKDCGLDRKSLVIGLGGGIINDISGFVASIYMRGIEWIMIPTTLTAQADAAIGGKTGVNLEGFKNMVGSFWPAKAVLIDPGFLDTLPKDHARNGLAEIIKMGFIFDEKILEHVAKMKPGKILGTELDAASELAAKAKIDIVAKDTYESGERKLLNFGHTVGHALEAISHTTDKPLLHGEAISIGMIAEARLAESEGICEPGLADTVSGTLGRFSLPLSYDKAELNDVLFKISADKKNVGDNILWTLPTEAGKGIFDHVASKTNIEAAVRSVIAKK
ncbi:MAG TPA: 3-dehydroquinate synthase [Candidatus Saccharimonadales bacterium]|nr:3-dehydroquinate synthase [Candidatus Saccharimonadales bacterium]